MLIYAAESFKAIISKWRASWDDITPSMQAGVRVHFTSLIEIVCPALQSQSWLVKTQGAAAIATITESMGKGLITGAPPHLGTLLNVLLPLITGDPPHLVTCIAPLITGAHPSPGYLYCSTNYRGSPLTWLPVLLH